MNASIWTLSGTQAQLRTLRFKAALDLSRSRIGLTDISIDGVPFANVSLLNIDAPKLTSRPPIDVYIRQQDLVATYEEPAGQRRRLQTYWRVLDDAPSSATTLELVVSVQTDLLHSQPAMYAASQFPDSEVLRFAADGNEDQVLLENNVEDRAGFVLVRPNAANVSFMQAAHPTDFSKTERTSSDSRQVELRHSLFAEPLEKGVIRRARIRLAILPRAGDLLLAAACYRHFAASEPMLTA